MPRVLIRSGKAPFTPVSAETTLTQDVFNSNSGNYLFQHAVWKHLAIDGTELVSNSTLSERRTREASDAHRANEEFDHFVVPLANAFRAEFIDQLDRLSTFIEGLTIPVTVTGVGAQAPHGAGPEVLEPLGDSVRRFVGAVLDRSASIGVRGTFTRDFLVGLGFPEDSIDVIGCPSLFLHGRDFTVQRSAGTIGADSRLALNLTPEIPGIGAFATAQAERHPRLTYLPQDAHDLRLMLWGTPFPHVHDPAAPVHIDHPLYRDDRMRMFVDTWTWIDHLAEHDFAYGTRFHGNVAALLAGTPALLLTHDSRTTELAEHHRMPHLPMPSLAPDVTAAELYAATDLTEFNAAMPGNVDRYVAFLERNGLDHVWAEGRTAHDFEAARAGTDLPGPVHTLAVGTSEIARRLQWLRNGMVLDITRHPERYEYPYEQPRWAGAGSRHARLKRENDAARRKLAAKQKASDERIAQLEQSLGRLQKRLDRAETWQRRSLRSRTRRLLDRVKRRLVRS
jgi:hypothetical protein